jgi:hypothetical protein
LTDSQGHKIDFRNTLIVFTSNLGADILVGNDPLHPYKEDANGDIALSVRNAVMDVVQNNCKLTLALPHWKIVLTEIQMPQNSSIALTNSSSSNAFPWMPSEAL